MRRFDLVRILVAGSLVISSLLPGSLCAEPQLASPSTDRGQRQRDMLVSPVNHSELSGGIIVVLDFSDGEFIADLAAHGNFVAHGLLTDGS